MKLSKRRDIHNSTLYWKSEIETKKDLCMVENNMLQISTPRQKNLINDWLGLAGGILWEWKCFAPKTKYIFVTHEFQMRNTSEQKIDCIP